MKNFDGQRYELAAFMVMDDHVHALVTPLANYGLESIFHSWKSFSAREMKREHGRFGRVWQDGVLRTDQFVMTRTLCRSAIT
jgi:putative DNA methylase